MGLRGGCGTSTAWRISRSSVASAAVGLTGCSSSGSTCNCSHQSCGAGEQGGGSTTARDVHSSGSCDGEVRRILEYGGWAFGWRGDLLHNLIRQQCIHSTTCVQQLLLCVQCFGRTSGRGCFARATPLQLVCGCLCSWSLEVAR